MPRITYLKEHWQNTSGPKMGLYDLMKFAYKRAKLDGRTNLSYGQWLMESVFIA